MSTPDFMSQYPFTAVPEFYAQVTRTFAFLESKYGYHLHTQEVKDIRYFRDTYAQLSYIGERVAVDLFWYFSSAAMGVSFTELLKPHEVPPRAVFFGTVRDAARAMTLYSLASALGHADDADFLLGDPDLVDEPSIEKRSTLLRTNMSGVLEGLARATERYASDVLRGDTSIFPVVMRFYEQKLQAKRNAWQAKRNARAATNPLDDQGER